MKQMILTQFPWPLIPTIGMLIFFIFFLGVLIFCLIAKADHVNAQAVLPLSEGERHE